SFLIARCGRPDRLLWVEGADGREWDQEEAAALGLAGQLFGQCQASDLAEVRAMADVLEQRLYGAGALASRIAHDLDNMLTGVLGFTELALAQLPPASPLQQYLNEAIQAAQLAARITQELHQLSRGGRSHPGQTALLAVVGAEELRQRELLP